MSPTVLLVISWIAFAVLHSMTASYRFKKIIADKLPTVFPYYRLLFNLFSTVTVLVPLFLAFKYESPLLWQWQGLGQWLMHAIAAIGIIGFFYSTRFYDGLTFIGLRRGQPNHIGSADEPLVISPLHRYVRHPWYFFGLLLIWTRDMNLPWLISCIMISLYFLLGSRLEERKLVAEYGEVYARYCKNVPGIFPLPWRYLSKNQAVSLLEKS